MNMDDVVARCSKFSGYKLTWRIEKRKIGLWLLIEEPGKPDSTLIVCPTTEGFLHEVYARLRQWGITAEEQETMKAALRKATQEGESTRDLEHAQEDRENLRQELTFLREHG